MWDRLAAAFLDFEASDKPVITFLKVNKLLFISIASFYATPVFPVKDDLSLPARSTNYNFD